MGWSEDVINYHIDPKQFYKWCGLCGCEGGCNLCDRKSLKHALKLVKEDEEKKESNDTFSLTEKLIELIPKVIDEDNQTFNFRMEYFSSINEWCVGHYIYGICLQSNISWQGFHSPKLTDALYELACWCIENNHIRNG